MSYGIAESTFIKMLAVVVVADVDAKGEYQFERLPV